MKHYAAAKLVFVFEISPHSKENRWTMTRLPIWILALFMNMSLLTQYEVRLTEFVTIPSGYVSGCFHLSLLTAIRSCPPFNSSSPFVAQRI